MAPPAPKKPAPPPVDDIGERTMVMPLPKTAAEEDDWTSLVDELDK